MKIAIQGHPTRGKEVIQILESLGGINIHDYLGSNDELYYEIYGNSIICLCTKDETYKYYTLEEFEKEFPFKVGDLCIYQSEYLGNITVKVLRMIIQDNDIVYEIGPKDADKTYSGIYRKRDVLKPYEEMKEERFITLTLDKAKEWYKKGGELKEVTLQAFSEKELNILPRNWEEFCDNYPRKKGESYVSNGCSIITLFGDDGDRDFDMDRNICPSEKSAEAHLAMIQLEQLRDCWRNGWEPIWDASHKWCIRLWGNEVAIGITINASRFLTFPTKEMAVEFLECFRDLIEKAKDLI